MIWCEIMPFLVGGLSEGCMQDHMWRKRIGVHPCCNNTPPSQKTFAKLEEDFYQAFVPRDMEDQAHRELFFLSMTQFDDNFDQYAAAF